MPDPCGVARSWWRDRIAAGADRDLRFPSALIHVYWSSAIATVHRRRDRWTPEDRPTQEQNKAGPGRLPRDGSCGTEVRPLRVDHGPAAEGALRTWSLEAGPADADLLSAGRRAPPQQGPGKPPLVRAWDAKQRESISGHPAVGSANVNGYNQMTGCLNLPVQRAVIRAVRENMDVAIGPPMVVHDTSWWAESQLTGATDARHPFGFASVPLYYMGMDTVRKEATRGPRRRADPRSPMLEGERRPTEGWPAG